MLFHYGKTLDLKEMVKVKPPLHPTLLAFRAVISLCGPCVCSSLLPQHVHETSFCVKFTHQDCVYGLFGATSSPALPILCSPGDFFLEEARSHSVLLFMFLSSFLLRQVNM